MSTRIQRRRERLSSNYTTIEYPSAGATYSNDCYGVYRYGTYPRGSVLEGQESRSFLASFSTLEEAQAAYPEADATGCQYHDTVIPETAPEWFDPSAAGERWMED